MRDPTDDHRERAIRRVTEAPVVDEGGVPINELAARKLGDGTLDIVAADLTSIEELIDVAERDSSSRHQDDANLIAGAIWFAQHRLAPTPSGEPPHGIALTDPHGDPATARAIEDWLATCAVGWDFDPDRSPADAAREALGAIAERAGEDLPQPHLSDRDSLPGDSQMARGNQRSAGSTGAVLGWEDISASCDRDETTTRDAAFVATLWETAARSSPHRSLRRRDVRDRGDHVLIHFRETKGTARWVELTRSVPHLRAWLAELNEGTPGAEIPPAWPVWTHPGEAGSPPAPPSRGVATRICRRADLDVESPQDVRRARVIQQMEFGDEEG